MAKLEQLDKFHPYSETFTVVLQSNKDEHIHADLEFQRFQDELVELLNSMPDNWLYYWE